MVTKRALFALFLTLTPTMAKAEIRGLYGTHCLEGKGISAVKDLLFREQTLETVQTVFADLTCEIPSYDFSFSGPYDLDTETGHLDYAYASIKLQALSETVVAKFNEASLCGFTDWKINKPKEVSGLDCGGQLIPVKDTRAFDLVKESPFDASVQLGLITDQEDGLSSAARPTRLENFTYYAK